MTKLTRLVTEWREEADSSGKYGNHGTEDVFNQCADELEAALAEHARGPCVYGVFLRPMCTEIAKSAGYDSLEEYVAALMAAVEDEPPTEGK
jgi:hypothetical protein